MKYYNKTNSCDRYEQTKGRSYNSFERSFKIYIEKSNGNIED